MPRRKKDAATGASGQALELGWAARGGWTGTDTYLDLVRPFALVPIRDDEHLKAASRVIDQLLRLDLDEGQQDYLDVLTDLVEAYEDEHVATEIPDATEVDVLRELMNLNGLTQAELRARTGIAQSTISAVLNGTRSLTRAQVLKLADHFGVSPSAFLPTEGRPHSSP